MLLYQPETEICVGAQTPTTWGGRKKSQSFVNVFRERAGKSFLIACITQKLLSLSLCKKFSESLENYFALSVCTEK